MPHEILIHLIQTGDVRALSAMLDAQPELLRQKVRGKLLPETLGRGQEGNTLLHVAAFCGGKEILAYLIRTGANLDARNAEYRTPMHVALEHNLKAVQELEELGVEKDIIHAACRHDHDRLRAILTANPELATDKSTGLSVMGWSTYHGARASIEMLIEAGAGPDDLELRCAAGVANAELAELLIDHGADVDEVSPEDGTTALHVAVAHPYSRDATALVALLLERGAERSICENLESMTPLDLAQVKLEAQDAAGIDEDHAEWRNFAGVIGLLED